MKRYSTSEPIGATCPDIDDVIMAIQTAITHSDSIQDALHGQVRAMESLRNANSLLREWGEQGASRVEDLEQQVADLEQQVADLEDQLEEVKSKIP